jgi:hypothetical protein
MRRSECAKGSDAVKVGAVENPPDGRKVPVLKKAAVADRSDILSEWDDSNKLDILGLAEFPGKSIEFEKAFVLVIENDLFKNSVSGRNDILKK